MPCWFFEKNEIHNSPSRKDGISAEVESKYRTQGAMCIIEASRQLGFNFDIQAVAAVCFHRFYTVQSFSRCHRYTWTLKWQVVICCCDLQSDAAPHRSALKDLLQAIVCVSGCLFLAGKLRNCRKSCKEIAQTLKTILGDAHFAVFGSSPQNRILEAETALMETLKFDLEIEHPYTYLLKFAKLLKGEPELLQQLVQTAWSFLDDGLSTTLCIQYEPDILAIAILHLASRLKRFKITDWYGKPGNFTGKWYMHMCEDVNCNILEDVCNQIMRLYSDNSGKNAKKDRTPSSLPKSPLPGMCYSPSPPPRARHSPLPRQQPLPRQRRSPLPGQRRSPLPRQRRSPLPVQRNSPPSRARRSRSCSSRGFSTLNRRLSSPSLNLKQSSRRDSPSLNPRQSSRRDSPSLNLKQSSRRDYPSLNPRQSSRRDSPSLNPRCSSRDSPSFNSRRSTSAHKRGSSPPRKRISRSPYSRRLSKSPGRKRSLSPFRKHSRDGRRSRSWSRGYSPSPKSRKTETRISSVKSLDDRKPDCRSPSRHEVLGDSDSMSSISSKSLPPSSPDTSPIRVTSPLKTGLEFLTQEQFEKLQAKLKCNPSQLPPPVETFIQQPFGHPMLPPNYNLVMPPLFKSHPEDSKTIKKGKRAEKHVHPLDLLQGCLPRHPSPVPQYIPAIPPPIMSMPPAPMHPNSPYAPPVGQNPHLPPGPPPGYQYYQSVQRVQFAPYLIPPVQQIPEISFNRYQLTQQVSGPPPTMHTPYISRPSMTMPPAQQPTQRFAQTAAHQMSQPPPQMSQPPPQMSQPPPQMSQPPPQTPPRGLRNLVEISPTTSQPEPLRDQGNLVQISPTQPVPQPGFENPQ